mgnify:CR=1 FL=1
MNDSTPDNSGATPEADAADMAPAAKKPAAKRAPRKGKSADTKGATEPQDKPKAKRAPRKAPAKKGEGE